ncbi:MAG: hypothetical protein R2867_03140 [Caldilineaceae bacterium]
MTVQPPYSTGPSAHWPMRVNMDARRRDGYRSTPFKLMACLRELYIEHISVRTIERFGAQRLLEREPQLTAITCFNDRRGDWLCNLCRLALQCKADIAVVGLMISSLLR